MNTSPRSILRTLSARLRGQHTSDESQLTPEEQTFRDLQHNLECYRMMFMYGLIVGTSLLISLIVEVFFIPNNPFHDHLLKTLPFQIMLAYLTSLGFRFEVLRRHSIGFSMVATIMICAMGGVVMGGLGGFRGPYFYSVYMMPVFIMWIPCKVPLRILGTVLNIGFYTLCFMSQHQVFDAPGIDITLASLLTIGASSLYQGHRQWSISSERAIALYRLDHAHETALARSGQLTDRLRQQTERAHALAHEVFDAREYERVKVARDLHDDTGQMLVGAKMELELLEHQLTQGKELGHEQVEHLHSVMHGLEHNIRDMIRRLRAERLDIDLQASLEEFQRTHAQLTHIDRNCDMSDLEMLGPEVTHMIYRLVQEGLTNASKYSDGDQWKIVIRQDPDEGLHVSILDNGSPPSSPHMLTEGWGIAGLGERAGALGGEVSLRHHQGWTRLELTLPIDRKASTHAQERHTA